MPKLNIGNRRSQLQGKKGMSFPPPIKNKVSETVNRTCPLFQTHNSLSLDGTVRKSINYKTCTSCNLGMFLDPMIWVSYIKQKS